MRNESISDIIDQAKQQRAEYIGAAIRRHPVVTALVAAVPVLLVQPWSESPAIASVLRYVRTLAKALV